VLNAKIWAIFVIFKNMTQVNNRPKGEKLPDLVALMAGLELTMHLAIFNASFHFCTVCLPCPLM
jgi:hypothetical protein